MGGEAARPRIKPRSVAPDHGAAGLKHASNVMSTKGSDARLVVETHAPLATPVVTVNTVPWSVEGRAVIGTEIIVDGDAAAGT